MQHTTMFMPDPESRAYFPQTATTMNPSPLTAPTTGTNALPNVSATTETRTPTVGNIVNYVLESGRSRGDVRPAIIVRTWSPSTVQLQVFTDAYNDFGTEYTASSGLAWRTSVLYSEAKTPGTWHWPDTEVKQFPVIEAATL